MMNEVSVAATTASVRDELRRAAAAQHQAVSLARPWRQPQDVGLILSHLSTLVAALDCLLDGLHRGLATEAAVAAVDSVDGPFEGDVAGAVQTGQLWLNRARGVSPQLRAAIDNAHVALSGLASR